MKLPYLRGRHREPELMDAEDLDPARHIKALRALARVNRVSLVAARVWREVLHLSRMSHDRQRDEPLRLLDVACGGGDVMVDVARRAHKASVPLVAHGCDLSPVALEHARCEAERWGVAVDFFVRDVVAEGLPGGYDLVCSSLFHHHLSWEDAVELLKSPWHGQGMPGRPAGMSARKRSPAMPSSTLCFRGCSAAPISTR